jgi:hypothetical protein
MRKLDAEESAERMRWLSGDNWPKAIFATCIPWRDLSKGPVHAHQRLAGRSFWVDLHQPRPVGHPGVSSSTALSGAPTEHGDLDTVRCG